MNERIIKFKEFITKNRAYRILLSSLTRRIFIFNLIGLIVMLSSILYLNLVQDKLIKARVESLKVQSIIIAEAIAGTNNDIIIFPTIDPEKLLEQQAVGNPTIIRQEDEHLHFPINPVRVAPILRNLIYPTRTQTKIFDIKGRLIIDSKHLYFEDVPEKQENKWSKYIYLIMQNILPGRNLPIYIEIPNVDGLMYEEIRQAIIGNIQHATRKSENGETIVSVAVPIKRYGKTLGVMHMTTQAGDIDKIIRADQWAIISIFLITSVVTLFLSMLLASTIATPLRKLSDAAEKVKIGIKRKEKIPDFSYRQDEIGHLSTAIRDMTKSLYKRIEDIESFAADVSHELKNPLTSLRSAVETLPKTKNEEQQKKLLKIIEHDVLRLDRLITDISDASRLDAELARVYPEPVDISLLLQQFHDTNAERTKQTGQPPIHLKIIEPIRTDWQKKTERIFTVGAHKDRIGQVLSNLVDNARSFIDKKNGQIDIQLTQNKNNVIMEVCDNGTGIDPQNFEKIFDRFYTDRPEPEKFGQNSGLGLSITRQIVEAHGGIITASNNKTGGACMRISIPICKGSLKI